MVAPSTPLVGESVGEACGVSVVAGDDNAAPIAVMPCTAAVGVGAVVLTGGTKPPCVGVGDGVGVLTGPVPGSVVPGV